MGLHVVRTSGVYALATRSMRGRVWHRSVPAAFLADPLGFAHTTTSPGRYNPGSVLWPQFPIVYLCDDPFICRFETRELLGSPSGSGPVVAVPPVGPLPAIVAVHVTLSAVVDLTRRSQRRLVGTTNQELAGDWGGYRLRRPTAVPRGPLHLAAPTQRLGAALHAVPGVEGFLAYSAQAPTHVNLMVFPDRLQPGSQLLYTDPATGQNHTVSPPP